MNIHNPYLIVKTNYNPTILKLNILNLTDIELKCLDTFAKIDTPNDFDERRRNFFVGSGYYDYFTIMNIQNKFNNSITFFGGEEKDLIKKLSLFNIDNQETIINFITSA